MPSPLIGRRRTKTFIDDDCRVLVCSDTYQLASYVESDRAPAAFESAGPRRTIFFEPKRLTAGIVTCGGLCPGQNDVIRSLVLTLIYAYGVERILGFQYGYAGLAPGAPPPVELSKQIVDQLHEQGGTLLASSRGAQDPAEMVDTLVRQEVGLLFTVGGDGTLRGAAAICEEIGKRGLPIAVVGVPKTIDNDLGWIERSFGFATAVDEARRAIAAAHSEARGAWNGIGLVKLMGRHSGFIAAHACLSRSDVNFCLVPEVPFDLGGDNGFLRALERRIEERRHAVILVAEGAAQDLMRDDCEVERDPSGNVRLKDVGPFLKREIASHFEGRQTEITIKYIDPSYMVRSCPANAVDSELCLMLGQHAVHAGMAGRTNMLVGSWNQRFTHVPIALAVERRRQIDPEGELWQRVLEATGQHACMTEAGVPSIAPP